LSIRLFFLKSRVGNVLWCGIFCLILCRLMMNNISDILYSVFIVHVQVYLLLTENITVNVMHFGFFVECDKFGFIMQLSKYPHPGFVHLSHPGS